jgi:hypothetical protein
MGVIVAPALRAGATVQVQWETGNGKQEERGREPTRRASGRALPISCFLIPISYSPLPIS